MKATVNFDSPAVSTSAGGRNTAPSLFPYRAGVVSARGGDQDANDLDFTQNRPLLIEDFLKDCPTLRDLTPEFLRARFGNRSVPIYDRTFGDPGSNYMGRVASMSLGDFVSESLSGSADRRVFLYNIGRHIPELLTDLEFPKVGLRFSPRFVYAFMGHQGATTPLHYDIDMGLVMHTAIHGRRRVRLFAPDQSLALSQHPFTVRSYANFDSPDFDTHPALGYARGYEVVLEPGQTLFMPAGYWHEFHYLDAGFGISLRAVSPRLVDRLRGLVNLSLLSPIDRLANAIAPQRWFEWKTRRAVVRAEQFAAERTEQ